LGSDHDREGITVLALIDDKDRAGAVEVYRVTMPYTYLNNNHSGVRCGWMPKGDAVKLLQGYDLDTVFGNDIIVLHRMLTADSDGKALVEACRCRAAKVVYEADDDYSGDFRPPEVPGQTWKPYLPYVDAITVSTKRLSERVCECSKGQPVYVLPNSIDYTWFTKVAQQVTRLYPDNLTIMLAGTKTHYQDWIVLREVIPDLLADYPDVKFLVAAYVPEYLKDTGVETVAGVPYTSYPTLLAQADILCAPLVPDDQFNACKSPIKAIEGWCAGCAVIATDCVVYRGTVQKRHNGLLVEHTPEAWDQGLRVLISDQLLRQKLQREGLRDARAFDVALHWQDWQRAYTEIRRQT